MYSVQVSGVAGMEKQTHTDAYEMIFVIMAFLVYSSAVIQIQKNQYTPAAFPLFILLQFIFTKYIHTYLIDKYIM